MAPRTCRRRGTSRRGSRAQSHIPRLLVVGVVLLLVVAPLTVGFVGLTTASSANEDATKLDIVFVFDRSNSTNDDRRSMAREIGALDARLDAAGVDARYALITYSGTASVEQPLTSDFDEFERAMYYQEGGNTEMASDAIPMATEMAFRENATRVVVLFTDEDDDSTPTARQNALSVLQDVRFIGISPATPYESSCAVHSPPCDSESGNELRTMTEKVGGTWIDVDADASTIVDRIGDVLDPRPATGNSNQVDRSSPTFVTTGLSTNVSTAEVGDPVAFNKTVENTGDADGTYDAYLSHDGKLLSERSVDIPARSTRTITFVHAFEQPGSYTLQITHESVGPVEITDPRNESVTTTTRHNGTVIDASVTDARSNGTVTIPLNGSVLAPESMGTIRNSTLSIGDVNSTPTHDVAFDVEIAANATPPNGTAPLPGHVTNGTYLTVTSTLGDDLTGVQFEYETTSNDTILLGYDANTSEWVPLSRTASRTANGTTTWQTDANTYSTYAIGVGSPQFDVTDVSLHAQQIQYGETAGVSVFVTNTGSATGTYPVTVRMDGDTYVEQVTVPATETREAVLRFKPKNAGTFTVQVDDGASKTLLVQPAKTTTTASTTETTTSTVATTQSNEGRSQILAPGFAIFTMVIAAILLGLLGYYRR